MFSDIPILGLTATASSKVITDTQKLLQIQGCAVLKATFNRPNLFYEVIYFLYKLLLYSFSKHKKSLLKIHTSYRYNRGNDKKIIT